jgi:rare lipoprotein A
LRHFRVSHRRRLRDALIAGAFVAAVGTVPRMALAHSPVASAQIGSHRTASKVALPLKRGESRDRRRSLRAKLFSSPPQRLANSSQSPSAAETGKSESVGVASIYSDRQTASGELMDANKMTAAHRTLPFGTRVTVVNRGNGRSVVVRINDRGPFVHGRVIDLSPAAGRALNIDGLASVSLTVGDSDEGYADERPSEGVAAEEWITP